VSGISSFQSTAGNAFASSEIQRFSGAASVRGFIIKTAIFPSDSFFFLYFYRPLIGNHASASTRIEVSMQFPWLN